VLLSFAQFEREVTGERIRDKFAASKKKGIWMGGNPPLGYDVGNRKLLVNSAEAETVRLIFQRYLDMGCVRLLRDDLLARGIISKCWTSRAGERRGGKPLGRSALYCILNNRVYVGETMHKSVSHRGEHDAIVPRELFDTVQQRLADLRPPVSGKARLSQDAPLTGLLFDETGEPMLPTYTIKQGGIRYRYYASKPTLKGERSRAVIYRIPAPPFEDLISGLMERLRLLECQGRDGLSALRRINIKSNSIIVELDSAAALSSWRTATPAIPNRTDQEPIDYHRGFLANGEEISEDSEHLLLSLPVRARFRGGRSAILQLPGPAQRAPQPDEAIIKAIARAHRWRQMLLDGEVTSIEALAARLKLDRGHVGLTLNLAFLSPNLTRAIVRGEQPAGLRLTHLLGADIPLSWRGQATAVARAANAARA